MQDLQNVVGKRHAALLGMLMLSSASWVLMAQPALAQIETVVVTAEKRAADAQTVPIAISAYSSEDLAARQITQFKDLQFSSPNVSFSKNNFTSFNFQIRGIGTQVLSGDSEFGVAFNINDMFYSTPPVDAAQFYDIERIEVLRGPQSTLYGRGATGGVVSVFTKKPDLTDIYADAYVSYGNYGATEMKGMVNLPIIEDKLGLRLAGDWVYHDGYVTNVNQGRGVEPHPDSRNQWSMRGSLRWQPSEDTTIDLVASHANENDRRMRAQKQLCTFDPTGVLGCLPGSLGNEPVNLNATFFNIPLSRQALTQLFDADFGPGTGAALGLFDLSAPYVPVANAVPSDPRKINSDFNPSMKGRSNSVTLEAKHKINNWLDVAFVGGYSDYSLRSQQSYTNAPAPQFGANLTQSIGTFRALLNAVGGLIGQPNYGNQTTGPYAFVINPIHDGTLPTSNFTNFGVIGGSINRYSNNQFAYDQSSAHFAQSSAELRFSSNLDGPVNFMVAAYYLNVKDKVDYFVASNALDYSQIMLGALTGPAAAPGLCATAQGCIFGTPYYNNDTARSTVESKAIYGELYYDALPDTLKLTLGLRATEDIKTWKGRITVLNGYVPTGSTDAIAAMDVIAPYENTKRTFDKLTGRLVADYTPDLDFTDSTLIYASYSRGYKAGGSNPGVQAGNIGVPLIYEPEQIDAYEIGTKNLMFDGTLQANLTAWYYNYGDYQISTIMSNTSVNTNINAFLHGLEGELRWNPAPGWEFSFNFDVTKSKVGRTAQIDVRNPTGGNPRAVLIKDGTLTPANAQNCVLYYTGNNFAGDFATLAALSQGVFYAPPGGTAALAGSGVANAAFGTCYAGEDAASPFYAVSIANPAGLGGLLAATNFSQSDPLSPGSSLTGVPVNLQGNELPNTPPASLSLGAQYTHVLGEYALVSRLDYFWQAASWGRIFNSPADRIDPYSVVNAQVSLIAPDDKWSVQAYVKNLFDSDNITGHYLSSASSGLYTGVFYGDPRTFGVALSVRL